MIKRIIAVILVLVVTLGIAATIGNAVTPGEYMVGYAKVDINPYVDENDHSKGLMALPMAGNSYNAQRLSEPTKVDDTGDGVIDDRDGIFATCIAITDPSGNTMLIVSADFCNSNATLVTDLRIAIHEKYPEIDPTQVMYTASHTHSSIDLVCSGLPEKSAADLVEYNRRLRVNLLRMVDEALADRSAATMHKGQIEANDSKASTQPIGDTINKYRASDDQVTVLPASDYPDRVYNSVRHYAISIYPAKRTVIKRQSGDKLVYYSYPKDANKNYLPDTTAEPITYIRGSNFNPDATVGGTVSNVYYADENGNQIATTKEEAEAWSVATGKQAYWLADMGVVASKENVAEGDDTLLALEFRFKDTTRKPIVLINWRAHTTLNRYVSDDAEELKELGKYQDLGFYTSYYQISGDWVNAMRFVLEEEGYRPAFVEGAAGNMVAGGSSGENGNWVNYETETDRTHFRNRGNIYGTEMAEVALECLREHMVQVNVNGGDIRNKQIVYQTQKQNIQPGMFIAAHIYKNAYKPASPLGTRPFDVVYWLDAYGEPLIDNTTGKSKVDDNTGKALFQTDVDGNLVTDASGNAVYYTDKNGNPVVGVTRIEEVQKIASIHHANSVINKYKSTSITNGQLELNVFMIGNGFAMVTAPNELFDRYSTEATMETINQYNDWEKLWDADTYGEPFMMGYANDSKGYISYQIAWDYSKGVLNWSGKDIYAQGSYETQTGWFEKGTGEQLIDVYRWMLDTIDETNNADAITGYCEHCQAEVLWYPFSSGMENTVVLTSGHYYADVDTITDVSIRTANNVCFDICGKQVETVRGRMFNVNKTSTLNIQDSVGGGTLIATGTTVSSKLYGGLVYVDAGGRLNLYSGSLTNCFAEDLSVNNGGVVYVGGSFYMYGGIVKDGTSDWAGGNVYIAPDGAMYVYGGLVTGGTAEVSHTNCIVARGAITIGGDARIDKIRLWPNGNRPAMEDILTVDGKYTGKVRLYIDGASNSMDIGNLINGGSYGPENIYFSNNTYVPYITGTDMILGSAKAAAIYGENGFEGFADTLQAAINACQGTDKVISLQKKNTAAATVSKNVNIDLNGYNSTSKITIKSGATVYLKDSATNDFTGTYGQLQKYSGTIKPVEGYVLLKDSNNYVSAHAYALEINTVTLRPSVSGIYFGGSIKLDENISVIRKGIVVSLDNEKPVADGSDVSCLCTTGDTSAIVTNILGADKTLVENVLGSTMPIYARAYAELTDGTIIYSDVVTVNLRQIVEAVDARWGSLTQSQKESISAMQKTYEYLMEGWMISNLKLYK